MNTYYDQVMRMTAYSYGLCCAMVDDSLNSFSPAGFRNTLGLTEAELQSDLIGAAMEAGCDVVFDNWQFGDADQPTEIVVAFHKDIGVELLRACVPVVSANGSRLKLYAPRTHELVFVGEGGLIRRQAVPSGWELDPAVRRGAKLMAAATMEMVTLLSGVLDMLEVDNDLLSAGDAEAFQVA